MARWTDTGEALPVELPRRFAAGPMTAAVRENRGPVRLDLVGAIEAGVRSSVAAPITVEGNLWGCISAASTNPERPPAPGTETRLSNFSDLVATAIANAEGRSELAASRRRIVAASDETRRRIERDLHDGTQQRLVSLGLAVRAAEANLPPERDDLRAQLSGVATGLVAAVEDLQEICVGSTRQSCPRAVSARRCRRSLTVPRFLSISTSRRTCDSRSRSRWRPTSSRLRLLPTR